MRALAAHQSRGPAVLSDAEPCCSGRPWAPAPAPSAASRRPVLTKMGRHEEFSLWREELPIPKGYTPGVVAGVRTVATPLLSQEKVLQRLQNAVHPVAAEHFGAFYSSELGGIVTDPALMLVHMDDHMVHRGHGVFDTCLITDGHAYQLPRHLARFKASAQAAGLVFPRSDEAIMRIILDTAAASRKLNGIVKYWLTAGRGGFGLSPRECIEPGFYALASSETVPKMNNLDKLTGWHACTSTVAPNEPPFSTIKSSNYLRNTLLQMDAEQRGFDVGIFVDSQGRVQEGPNMNIGIITKDDVLVTPPAEGCLAGVTMQRVIELIPEESKRSPNDVVIKDIRRAPLTIDDLLKAKEVFLTGSTLRVMPVVSIDEENIADGTPGITALALDAMLVEDMKVTEAGPTPRHIPLPYGFTTAMRDQLV